jgi:response regulator NasT
VRIILIDENKARAAIIAEGLSSFSEIDLHIVSDRHGIAKTIAEINPDVILIDLGNPSRDILEEYFNVSRAVARPIAMFVDESDDDTIGQAIDAGVSAYIVDGLAPKRLRSILDLAIRRFNVFARLQGELQEAKDALAARDVIAKAKQILMEQKQIGETQAYKMLRNQAMNNNRRIVEVSEAIIMAHELLKGQE